MAVYQNYTDPELLEAFRSGEEAAFREIYDRYDKLLYAFAFRKLRDGQEAMGWGCLLKFYIVLV